jgi:rhodanese-related sulfurtransferase
MEHLPEFILHHWQLFLAFAILLILIVFFEIKLLQSQSNHMTPQEAVLAINHQQACVIDIRDSAAFATGHIIDAIQASKDDHANVKLKKYKEKPVILVCQKGNTTQQAAKLWMDAGYKHIHVLKGGIDAWREAGFPLVK